MNKVMAFSYQQIADFGMSRDLIDGNYYITSGGKIPVKWTAPEVLIRLVLHDLASYIANTNCRQYITKNTQFRVMYGVMDALCMKYGVWDINHLKN